MLCVFSAFHFRACHVSLSEKKLLKRNSTTRNGDEPTNDN